MDKVIYLIIEDDWELMGNGLGNVSYHQYLPAKYLMDIAKRYSMKISFMVEPLQQLSFRENQHKCKDLKLQADVWESTVQMMLSEGHDVQLHIHSQWHNARYENNFFYLNNRWNIADYEKSERREMIRNGIKQLLDVAQKERRGHKIHSFKAGSWGLQPSRGILEDLEECGIRVVMGVGKGIYLETEIFKVDYREIESPNMPYFPNYDDITKVSSQQENIIVMPLAYYKVRVRDILKRSVNKVGNLLPNKENYQQEDVPKSISTLDPMGNKMKYNRIRPLDFARNPLSEMCNAMDQIMKRAILSQADVVPILLQTHTKMYGNNINNVRRFLEYIDTRYGKILNYVTITDYINVLYDQKNVNTHVS